MGQRQQRLPYACSDLQYWVERSGQKGVHKSNLVPGMLGLSQFCLLRTAVREQQLEAILYFCGKFVFFKHAVTGYRNEKKQVGLISTTICFISPSR